MNGLKVVHQEKVLVQELVLEGSYPSLSSTTSLVHLIPSFSCGMSIEEASWFAFMIAPNLFSKEEIFLWIVIGEWVDKLFTFA